MANYQVSLGDFIEINIAQENDRQVAPWTMNRIYPIISQLKAGDVIEVTAELSEREHYRT